MRLTGRSARTLRRWRSKGFVSTIRADGIFLFDSDSLLARKAYAEENRTGNLPMNAKDKAQEDITEIYLRFREENGRAPTVEELWNELHRIDYIDPERLVEQGNSGTESIYEILE
ncbi:helix-turn-helix DNA-binding protein [Gordonia phage Ziko]|uniref:Helix-turn-helix DNA binding protein n=1 Tax=Gordonia phage Ziko TaxID=2591193 RepID=A0A514A5B4_9CAUD|nr:helix-turn-helix DNA-binding protein [Gordonia phage Ziko]